MTQTKNLVGVALALSALRSKNSPVIGEFLALEDFCGFLKKSSLEILQLLPLNDSGTQSSPYSLLSAFALNPIYISIPKIPAFDLICQKSPNFFSQYNSFVKKNQNQERWNFNAIFSFKYDFLRKIFDFEIQKSSIIKAILAFAKKNEFWIYSYCVFKALKEKYNQAAWQTWKKSDQFLTEDQIKERFNSNSDENFRKSILFFAWCQKIAAEQFEKAKKSLSAQKILLKGDLPILPNVDSADVWANPKLFCISQKTGQAIFCAGSPPDDENPEGQNWGFAIYDWAAHEKSNFVWWKNRILEAEKFFDAVRLDHTPGFFRFWAIPNGEENAILGHTEPFKAISRQKLKRENFSEERIKWMSVPHIPTIASANDMKIFCTQIGTENLWNFKNEIKTKSDILNVAQKKFSAEDFKTRKNFFLQLSKWNQNRLLIEVKKNEFVPAWNFRQSHAWQTLNADEKKSLEKIFSEVQKSQEKMWAKQAEKIFSEICTNSKMIFCAEDLGAWIEPMPKILQSQKILSLIVVRWARDWFCENHPYQKFSEHKKNAVCTTSVHDSSTLRAWAEQEIENQIFFEGGFFERFLNFSPKKNNLNAPKKFSCAIAKKILESCAKTQSAWFINPLQDFLYMEKKYWKKSCESERVNIPGTISEFNWTYRLPATSEKLFSDDALCQKIASISKIHKGLAQKTNEKIKACELTIAQVS